MTGKTIFACTSPVNTYWQLGALPPAEGDIVLLGWNLPSKQIDSGMPEDVGSILTGALTSISRVNFPISEVPNGALKTWDNNDTDQTRLLDTSNLIKHIKAVLKHTPPSVSLLSTRRKETAIMMFKDASYPWCLQGQIALLSAPDAVPPDIDRQTLLSLIGDDWTKHAALLRSMGVYGVLRPGVDGDIAGVLSLTSEFKRTLLEALAHQAQLAKFSWLLLSEKDFVDKL